MGRLANFRRWFHMLILTFFQPHWPLHTRKKAKRVVC
uniref:Uncharacterized protein n=1 Tax=Arundo donax TaxID=35708 RepID=A0A0A9BQ27_ARUDO